MGDRGCGATKKCGSWKWLHWRQQLWYMKERRVVNLLRMPAVVLATGSTSGHWDAHACSDRVAILLDRLNIVNPVA